MYSPELTAEMAHWFVFLSVLSYISTAISFCQLEIYLLSLEIFVDDKLSLM